jgi:ABC-type microcin C transport system permease subunit YejE
MSKTIEMTKYQKYKLIILSVFCFFLLLILWNYSPNGRYIIGERAIIIDTKTGTLYLPIERQYLEINEFTKMEKTNTIE